MDVEFENYQRSDGAIYCCISILMHVKSTTKKYKFISLENFRHSLNRYLQAPPFEKRIDIIKEMEFSREANQSYWSAIKELKEEGKETIDHHPEINETDLQKLYQSIHLSTSTLCGLQNIVQFSSKFDCISSGEEQKICIQ